MSKCQTEGKRTRKGTWCRKSRFCCRLSQSSFLSPAGLCDLTVSFAGYGCKACVVSRGGRSSGASSLGDDIFSELFMPLPDRGGAREFMDPLFCKTLAKNKWISWGWFYRFLGLPGILVIIPEFSKLKMAFAHFDLKFRFYNNPIFNMPGLETWWQESQLLNSGSSCCRPWPARRRGCGWCPRMRTERAHSL